jgi:hypothetical protein
MESTPSNPVIPQEQADDAAADAAQFRPQFGRRWHWTRQHSLAPVYHRIGETTVTLLRAFPAIQWSNQALWYQRAVRDAPAIYALPSDAFAEEAKPFLAGADPREIEGKQVISLIYLAPGADGATTVAKTLLASTLMDAPYYQVQLAHELLNCFCAAAWDGQTLRSGLRRANWGAGTRLQKGGALNDLLLDALLLDVLPRMPGVTLDALTGGMLGPYWQLAQLAARRLASLPVREVLFGATGSGATTFEHGLDVVLNVREAAGELDRALQRHDWTQVRTLLAVE